METLWSRSRKAILAGLGCALAVSIPLRAQDTHTMHGFAANRIEPERQLEHKFRSIPDAAHAERNLRRITSEPHMAGTEASHRLAEWLRVPNCAIH